MKEIFNYDTKTGKAGLEEQAASAAILASTGIPVPPETLATVSKFLDSTKDAIKQLTGWGDHSNTDKVPGGVVYFWKYVPGGPNYGQPIKNEDMTAGYFEQYRKDMAKGGEIKSANIDDYAEFEQLFNAYYPEIQRQYAAGNIKANQPLAYYSKLIYAWEQARKASGSGALGENSGVVSAAFSPKIILSGLVALILLGILFSNKKD